MPQPAFDLTINLGNLITLATLVVTIAITYIKGRTWLQGQLAEFRVTLSFHAQQLSTASDRLDRQEALYMKIMSDLQRIVGRLESDRFKKY